MTKERFIDHYELLQVARNADPETIERVFRLLAKRYHPDNKRTGDAERFAAISDAYSVLSDPKDRAGYDARYESEKQSQWSLFFEAPLSGVDEDRRIQRWILSILYKLRRRNSSDPGIGEFELESYLEAAEGQLDYHLWYLKEKGWMTRTDTGQWAITADGIDWITGEDQLLRKDRLITEGSASDSSEGSSHTPEDRDPESLLPQGETLSGEESEERSAPEVGT
jgi:curved DNA-binding protein CbpA